MTCIHMYSHDLIMLFLLITVTNSAAQHHGIAAHNIVARHRETSRLSFIIPRGGDIELMDEISETIQDSFMDVAITPWIQKHAVFIIKTIVASFFAAQILAYCGVIGDKGEGLLEWAEDNKTNLHVTFRKLVRVIRIRLEQMLTSFANLPDRAQFVTCVSIGASVFPLTVKTVAVTSLVTLVGFVLAEALHHVGVLGDVGEEIQEWVHGCESMTRAFRVWLNQKRKLLRKQLNVEELLMAVWRSLKNDRVFWAGLGVGAVASIVLDNEKTTQGLDVDENTLIK